MIYAVSRSYCTTMYPISSCALLPSPLGLCCGLYFEPEPGHTFPVSLNIIRTFEVGLIGRGVEETFVPLLLGQRACAAPRLNTKRDKADTYASRV